MFQPQFNLFREHKLIHFNEAGPAVRSPEQNETQEIKLLSTERIAKLFGKFENDLNKSKENPLTNEKSKLLLNRASEKTKEAHTKLIFDLAKMSLKPGQEVVDRILAQTNTIESNDQHTTKPIEDVKESLNSATVQDYWEAMKAMPKDELASILINLVPILGDAKGALESALAKDVITGEAQGALERVVGAASAIPFLGAPLDISAALAKLSSSIGVVILPIAKSGEKIGELRKVDLAKFQRDIAEKVKDFNEKTNPVEILKVTNALGEKILSQTRGLLENINKTASNISIKDIDEHLEFMDQSIEKMYKLLTPKMKELFKGDVVLSIEHIKNIQKKHPNKDIEPILIKLEKIQKLLSN